MPVDSDGAGDYLTKQVVRFDQQAKENARFAQVLQDIYPPPQTRPEDVSSPVPPQPRPEVRVVKRPSPSLFLSRKGRTQSTAANKSVRPAESPVKIRKGYTFDVPRDAQFVKEEEACEKNTPITVCVVKQKQQEVEAAQGGSSSSNEEPVAVCAEGEHTCMQSIRALYSGNFLKPEKLEVDAMQRLFVNGDYSKLANSRVKIMLADAGFRHSVAQRDLQLATGSESATLDLQKLQEHRGLGFPAVICFNEWSIGPVRLGQELLATLIQLSNLAYLHRLTKLQRSVMTTLVNLFRLRPFKPCPALQAYVIKKTKRGSALRRWFFDIIYMLVVELGLMEIADPNSSCEALGGEMGLASIVFKNEFGKVKAQYQKDGVQRIWQKPVATYLEDHYPAPELETKKHFTSPITDPLEANKRRRLNEESPANHPAAPSRTVAVIVSVDTTTHRTRVIHVARDRLIQLNSVRHLLSHKDLVMMREVTAEGLEALLDFVDANNSETMSLKSLRQAAAAAHSRRGEFEVYSAIVQRIEGSTGSSV